MNINVTRSSMPSYEEYCEEIKDLWDSRWLTNNGGKLKQLEAALAAYLDVPYVVLYTNGHLALENAIGAMDLPRGGEVITTPFTFISTTHAIARNGLTPVFCDVRPDDATLDPDRIESLITDKTCAIVPVHVYGHLCDAARIEQIAKRHGLRVIYDAAHAFGTRRQGGGIASLGDASMFSFHATKVFHTIEGGAVCTCSETLAKQLRQRRNFGLTSAEDADLPGGNAKMNEFQAAMGLCNLRHIGAELEKRRAAVLHYRARLAGVEGLRLSAPQAEVQENFAYFPVVFEPAFGSTRDEVFAALAAQEIGARKYFYPLTSDFTCYRSLPHGETPVADHMADHVLCLPLYADLAPETVDRICDTVLACKR